MRTQSSSNTPPVFPKKIRIPSDDTELKLIDIIKDIALKGWVARYVYTKSNVQLGKELKLPESEIDKMIKNKVAIEIKP